MVMIIKLGRNQKWKKGIMLISLLLVCSICLVGCVPKQSDTTNDNEATATQTKRDTVNLYINMALSTVDPHGNRVVQDLLVLARYTKGYTNMTI